MDHEHSEESRPCDHDDDVMCTHLFFDRTLNAHLARKRLQACMEGKQHWIFAITPECAPLLLKLCELCAERGAAGIDVLHLSPLPMAPALVCIPRDTLALDDLADLVDFSAASREAYERKDYIAITRLNTDVVNQALSNWINLDHLVN
jgi:hypothetical protein